MKKGFTLVELLVSLVLITILSLALFKTVVSIQEKQMQNIAINKFKAFEVTLNSEIEQDFLNDKIKEITECGKNCYNIEYKNRGTVKISVDTDNNTITYGTLKEKIPDDYKLYDDISMTKYESETEGANSFVYLNIPINSSLEPSKDGLKYMYVYDKNESNLVADLPEPEPDPDPENDPEPEIATEEVINKLGTCGVYKDERGDYRYAGNNSNVCNYVTFNGETWRIVGAFDTEKTVGGTKEKRLKIVREDLLGEYSWDTSASGVNNGYGINQWGASGSYDGADLMKELNGDYLNSSLSSNTTWYNGQNNTKTGVFDKNKALSSEAQELIDDAVWYLGAMPNGNHSAAQVYNVERGNVTCQASGATGCEFSQSGVTSNDGVKRTTNWTGKVALLYPSDYAYASSGCHSDNTKYVEYDSNAVNGYNATVCRDSNWLYENTFYWFITPKDSRAYLVWDVYTEGDVNNTSAYNHLGGVKPALYLKPEVLIASGSGTKDDPYQLVIENSKLPSEYKRLEYIQSTGTQYIDTEYYATNKTRIEVKYSLDTPDSCVFGSTIHANADIYQGAISNSYMLVDGSLMDSNLYLYYGTAINKSSTAAVTNSFNTAVIENGEANISEIETIKVSYEGEFTTSYPLHLFAYVYNDGAITYKGTTKIYYFRIYENGKLKRNMIPCYRKSDGEIGLYDKVNNKFYTNKGTGVFNKG